MNKEKSCFYEIVLEGELTDKYIDWFNGFFREKIYSADGKDMTTVSGLAVDQSHLRGVLMKIFDLNLDIVSIQRIPDPALKGVKND